MTSPYSRPRYPTHEEWMADAERHIRQQCYTHQRVDATINAYLEDDERERFATSVGRVRLAAFRLAKQLNSGRYVSVDDLHELEHDMQQASGWINQVSAAREQAGDAATDAAATREILRRKDPEAYAAELERLDGIYGVRHV